MSSVTGDPRPGTPIIDDDERRRRLGRRHWLAPSRPVGGVAALAGDLCGLHASDPASVYLAARARIGDIAVASVDEAWHDRHEVVKALGMRRTVFVIETPWLPVMHGACTLAIERKERGALERLIESSGTAPDGARWLAEVERAVRAALNDGEATGAELSKRVPQLRTKVLLNEGKRSEGEVGLSTRVLFLMGCAGTLVRARPKGSWISSQNRWALAETALGRPLDAVPTADAQATLARRWLAAFGPATAKDLQWWAGWTMGDTKRALAAIGAVTVSLADGSAGWVNADDVDPEPRSKDSWLAYLPSLDPTAMGWMERDWYLGPHRPAVFDRTGNIGPTIWLDGRIVGGWAVRRDGHVAHRLFEDLGKTVARRAATEAASVEAWLDGTVVTPRFPTPIDKELRG